VPALPAHTLLVISNLARPGMVVEIDIVAAIPA
jgi:enamine deaminase RidA (YjgF/YER057c/UK114 family)